MARNFCFLIALSLVIGAFAACGGQQAQTGVPAVPVQNAAVGPHRVGTDSRLRRGTSTATEFTTSGRDLLLNGKSFYIKGVDYGNAQIDAYPDPNPLDNANEPIWSPDLTAMRAAGVNAVKVYNVTLNTAAFKKWEYLIGGYNKLKPYETGKIDKFLDAAWNNGNKPVYVVLSIFFGGGNVNEDKYLQALVDIYGSMASEYAKYPAFMGISIGSEINSEEFINDRNWWARLNKISDSITSAYTAAAVKKITTTTMVDDGNGTYLQTVHAGELAGFKVDTWGVDVYRGKRMEKLWGEMTNSTEKPIILAEYGSSAGYYPASSAKYDASTGDCPLDSYPPGTKDPPNYGLPGPRPWEKIAPLPGSGNPRMDFLVTIARYAATEFYKHRASNNGTDSGGFYFEWNDEWWKSGWPFSHIGGLPGTREYPNKILQNVAFAGCYDDQAWFGLNEEKRAYASPSPFPDRSPDVRTPRPALAALKSVWASQ
jgi:hypothetical protein